MSFDTYMEVLNGFKKLAYAVVTQAVYDYEAALYAKDRESVEEIENFFYSELFDFVSDYDPEQVIQTVRDRASKKLSWVAYVI